MSRIHTLDDGEPVVLKAREDSNSVLQIYDYRVICCDCGLSHDVVYEARPKRKTLIVTVWQNNRSTAAVRRYLPKP